MSDAERPVEDRASRQASSASRAKLALRVLVSAALVGVLVWKVPLAKVGAALRDVPPTGIALAVLATAVQVLVGVLRWRRMLARTGVEAPFTGLLSDTLVAGAYNLVAQVGGDVVRAVRGQKRCGDHPSAAWSTTLFERMVGLPTLALVATPGILVVPGGRSLLVPAAVLAVVCTVLLVAAPHPMRFLGERLVARSAGASRVARGIADDLEGPLGTTGARLECFAWSLAYQAAGISILAAFVAPTGDTTTILAIYAGLPLIAIATMLPVTIGGLGLREGLFVTILGRLGVDEANALALSVLWLGTYVLVAAPGLSLLLLERGKKPA